MACWRSYLQGRSLLIFKLSDPMRKIVWANLQVGVMLILAGMLTNCSTGPEIRRLGSETIAMRASSGHMIEIDVKPITNAILTSRFGDERRTGGGGRRLHAGTDYGAPTGTQIYAAASGCIDIMDWRSGYGRFVLLTHTKDIQTAYAHLSRFAPGLQQGACVERGQTIGFVGATGRATGPHLHFELRYQGQAIDPLAN